MLKIMSTVLRFERKPHCVSGTTSGVMWLESMCKIHSIQGYNITFTTTNSGPNGNNKQNNPTLNPNKTTCTLFTPDPAGYTSNLDLKIYNTALHMATHPNVLGLTLCPKLTYCTQIHNISKHARKPLQIINALTTTAWGKQKETLMVTYKTVMKPALEYASSIWCCCLPTPMTLASGGSPMFPLVVHQPASPSIWPAVQSLRRGLSTNPGATMWCVCGCS